MANVDVERPVCGVDQRLTTRAVVFVAFLHRASVPVGPVNIVLEHGQSEWVRQVSVVHCVSVFTIQVWESEKKKKKKKRCKGHKSRCNAGQKSETTSWQTHLLDVIEMSIRPVELVVSVVDRDAVGPLDLGGDDGCFVESIHSNTAYKGFVSPVGPVHISNNNNNPRKSL